MKFGYEVYKLNPEARCDKTSFVGSKQGHVGPFYLDDDICFSQPPRRAVMCAECGSRVGEKAMQLTREPVEHWEGEAE